VYRTHVEVVEIDHYRVKAGSTGLFRIAVVKCNRYLATKRYVADILDLECNLEVAFRTRRRYYRKCVIHVGDVWRRIGRTSLRVQEGRLVKEVVQRAVRSLRTVTH